MKHNILKRRPSLPVTLKAGLAALLALTLAACATTTPYQAAPSEDGFGYSEQKLQENRYRVNFAGNSKTDRDTVRNYLLYRAAELTLAQGGDYFVVVNEDTDRKVERTGTTTGVGFGSPFFFGLGLGGTTSVSERDEYKAYGEILIREGIPASDQPNAYDARELMSNLEAEIRRPE